MKVIIIITLLFLITPCLSLIPYDNLPNWHSEDVTNVSTGAAWADINQNGYPDLITANGNDVMRQHLVVYFNGPEGLSSEIGWQSADIDYHGHIAVGDVNKNGFPDVAVSVYLGEAGFGHPGRVKLYLNNQGTLSSYPDWISADSMNTFSCALGDATGNGYLDLAVATGEMYTNTSDYNRIYYNNNGVFENYPSWLSDTQDISIAVGWGDFNNNGFLDVVFASCGSPNHVYFNNNGIVETIAGWSAADSNEYANSLFVADVNNNGFPDLAVSDNSQLGDNGHFKIYLNEEGILTSLPWWISECSGYGSGITLADVTANGYKDLIAGGWWEPVRIYRNNEGEFSSSPDWTASVSSVVEKIVVRDSRNSGVIENTALFWGNSFRRVFYLPESPLQSIVNILMDGEPLDTEDYCYDLEYGWISLSFAPSDNTQIEVIYRHSDILDIAVSNWGLTETNFVFYNNTVTEVNEEAESHTKVFQVYPNPSRLSSSNIITISLKSAKCRERPLSLTLYNVKGQQVRELTVSEKQEGQNLFFWDKKDRQGRTVGRGVYFFKTEPNTYSASGRIIIY